MHPKLRKLILTTYSPEDAQKVLQALESDPGSTIKELERVQCAVVKCGAGSLGRLLRAWDGAKIDYRDTLIAAGFGHDVKEHFRWLDHA